MSVYRTLMAAATAAFLFTGVAQAQTPAPEDRPTTGVPIARGEGEFDLGWLGLIGLLGLAGLVGRRRDRYPIDRGPSVRTDRI